MKPLLLALLAALIPLGQLSALTDSELELIGRRVWQNECGGTRDGLTSWNAGENFASLGIGHFIWYPRGVDGPFEESFPQLVRFLAENGVALPVWLKPGDRCPWSTRAEFQAAFHSEKMNQLRDLLAGATRQQSHFLAQRLAQSMDKMASAAGGDRENVARQVERLRTTAAGTFALIDYVNFKGEGTNPKERYHDHGWGLLQVLEKMHGTGPGAAREFSASAVQILNERVRNAPPERHEERWLPGWKNRVRSYAE